VEKRQVRTGNLHIDQIIHGHARLLQNGLLAIQQQLDLVFNLVRRLPGLCVEADSPRQIEGVANEDSVAEGRLHLFLGQIDGLSRTLWHGTRICLQNGKNSDHQHYRQDSHSPIHEVPPKGMRESILSNAALQSKRSGESNPADSDEVERE